MEYYSKFNKINYSIVETKKTTEQKTVEQNYEAVLKVRARGLFDSASGLTKYDGSPIWEEMASVGDIKPDYDGFDKMWKALKRGGLWYRPRHTHTYICIQDEGRKAVFNAYLYRFNVYNNSWCTI